MNDVCPFFVVNPFKFYSLSYTTTNRHFVEFQMHGSGLPATQGVLIQTFST